MKRPVTIRAVGRRDTEVSGPGVFDALTELQIPRMRPRVKTGNVWLIPANRADDLLAWCDLRKIPVTVML